MTQFARPTSDVTNTMLSGGFGDVDEVTASDTDFSAGDDNDAGAVLEVALSSVTDPALSTGHVVRVRLAKVDGGVYPGTGGNDLTQTVELYQGGTLVATIVSAVTAPDSWTQTDYTLTGTEADAITNYADLRIRYSQTGSGGSPANRRGGAISWAVLEVPDAGQDVAPALLDQTAVATAPTVTPGAVDLAPALLDQTAVATAPAVTSEAFVAPALLDQTAVPTAPAVTSEAFVAPALLDQTAVATAPVVQLAGGTQDVSPALLDQTAVTTEPAVTSEAFVAPALLDQTAVPTAPAVSPGAVDVAPALLDQTAVPTAPTVTPGAVDVAPALLDQTAVPTAPAVSSEAFVAPALLDQTAVATEPAVTSEAFVAPAILNQTAVATEPAIGAGAVDVSPALLDQTAVATEPAVSVEGGTQPIIAPLLDGTAGVFAPGVSTSYVLALGLIDATAQAIAPTILQSQLIVPALLDQTAAAFAPIVGGGSTEGMIAVMRATLGAGRPQITARRTP